MPTRRRVTPTRRRVPWVIFLAPFVLILGAVAFFLFRGEGPLGGGRETPEFSFEVRRVSQVAVSGREKNVAVKRATKEIHAVLDDLYTDGFVDPASWDGGRFPTIVEAFTGDAADRVEEDLGDLTLGKTARRLEFVQPMASILRISFLLDPDGSPYAAVAETTFRADGELERGGALRIAHAGTYFLQPAGDAWRIVGYEVEGSLDTERTAPEESP